MSHEHVAHSVAGGFLQLVLLLPHGDLVVGLLLIAVMAFLIYVQETVHRQRMAELEAEARSRPFDTYDE